MCTDIHISCMHKKEDNHRCTNLWLWLFGLSFTQWMKSYGINHFIILGLGEFFGCTHWRRKKEEKTKLWDRSSCSAVATKMGDATQSPPGICVLTQGKLENTRNPFPTPPQYLISVLWYFSGRYFQVSLWGQHFLLMFPFLFTLLDPGSDSTAGERDKYKLSTIQSPWMLVTPMIM